LPDWRPPASTLFGGPRRLIVDTYGPIALTKTTRGRRDSGSAPTVEDSIRIEHESYDRGVSAAHRWSSPAAPGQRLARPGRHVEEQRKSAGRHGGAHHSESRPIRRRLDGVAGCRRRPANTPPHVSTRRGPRAPFGHGHTASRNVKAHQFSKSSKLTLQH